MKKILTRVGIVLGALIIIALLLLGYLKKETTECRQGQGTVAIEACTMLVDHLPMEETKFTYLNLRRGHYAVAGIKQGELDDLAVLIKLGESGRFAVQPDVMSSVYGRAAEVNYGLGSKDEALKYADKAIQLSSKEPGVYMLRAGARLADSKFADALTDLKAAEGLGYDKLQLYMELGTAYLGINDYNNAYASLKKAEPLASAPQDVGMVNRQLGLTSFELKNYEESLSYMTKALLAGPCPDCSAVIKMSQGFIDKARAPKVKPKPAPKKKKQRR